MGQGTSRIQQPGCRYSDTFLIIGNPAEKVEFDTTQSHLVGFAIDYQSHEKMQAKSLGRSVVNDATLVSKTFVEIGAVPEGNATIHVASQNTRDCTFEGMKVCFIDAAKAVTAEGMFVFHFCGHGIRLRDQWGLAPSDFDRSDGTLVTASVLNDWLAEASCKAKHVLFALDCCYAGGIGHALTSVILHPSLFVVSACTANETSYAVSTLGHSMFSYFFADATRKKTSDPRKLPLYNILTECHTCCMALSSLLVKYEAPGKVSSCRIDPEMTFTGGARANNDDETDGVPEFSRFLYVTKHYDLEAPVLPLHAETKRWLKSIVEYITILRDRNLLKDKLLKTAVCSIMMSFASYQLAFQRDTVSHPNTFITAFLNMASFFDIHCPDVDVTIDHFKYGWGFYDYVLQKYTVDDAGIKALCDTILKENKASTDEEECDAAQNEGASPIAFQVWNPL